MYRSVHEPAPEDHRRRNYYCPGREREHLRAFRHTHTPRARPMESDNDIYFFATIDIVCPPIDGGLLLVFCVFFA